MAQPFVIEGQAGSGKTPLIHELAKQLHHSGYQVLVAAPFTAANQWVVDHALLNEYPLGIYSAWSASPEQALWASQWIFDYIQSTLLSFDGDIVLFDRGWLTAVRGLEDSCLNPANKKNAVDFWSSHHYPTFFLDTLPCITQSRKSHRKDTPWTNEGIHHDFDRRRILIQNCSSCLNRFTVKQPVVDLFTLSQEWAQNIIQFLD